MTQSDRTPLHDVHLALGATLTDFAGFSMPLRYGSETAEHTAVRATAGIFDLSHMGEIEIRGAQAARALDHALVTKPSEMGVGQARYSMLVDQTGGILDDVVTYRLQDDHYLVVANASNRSLVHSELLDRTADYDCEVRDASDYWALIAVQGPTSATIVDTVTDIDVTNLRYYSIAPGRIDRIDVLLARTGYTGEDGFEVYCSASHAPQIWEVLFAAGRDHGLVPAGLACRDSLRLEAGMPLYGQELSVDTTPYDVGLGRVVKLDKHEGFVGQSALRALHDQPPARRLVGLVCRGKRAPRTGYAVLTPNGNPVGIVTSGAPSPTLGHAVAMARVDQAHTETGTALCVDIRGRNEPVQVVELPFYKRPQ